MSSPAAAVETVRRGERADLHRLHLQPAACSLQPTDEFQLLLTVNPKVCSATLVAGTVPSRTPYGPSSGRFVYSTWRKPSNLGKDTVLTIPYRTPAILSTSAAWTFESSEDRP